MRRNSFNENVFLSSAPFCAESSRLPQRYLFEGLCRQRVKMSLRINYFQLVKARAELIWKVLLKVADNPLLREHTIRLLSIHNFIFPLFLKPFFSLCVPSNLTWPSKKRLFAANEKLNLFYGTWAETRKRLSLPPLPPKKRTKDKNVIWVMAIGQERICWRFERRCKVIKRT